METNNTGQPESSPGISSMPQSTPPASKKWTKLFLITGVLILLIAASCAGYYAGMQNKTSAEVPSNSNTPPSSPTPTVIQSPEITESNGMIEFIRRTDPPYEDYKITYPARWQRETRLYEDYAYHLLLHKLNQGEDGSKDYTLEISQGPGGLELECVFKTQEEFEKNPVIGQSMGINFKDFNGKLGAFRRSNEITEKSPEGENKIAICQLEKQFDTYANGTEVGVIDYILPDGFDPKMLEEMDEIVKTIEVVPKKR